MEAIIKNDKVVNTIVGHVEGSLPIRIIKPTMSPETHRYLDPIYEIDNHEVRMVYPVIELSEEILQQMADRIAELERINDVEAAQELHGLKSYTVALAEFWVTNKIDSAETVSEVKEATKEILLKMVPYLLK